MIRLGVAAGAAMPVQEITSKSCRPCSATVGISGRSLHRAVPVTESARTAPERTCGMARAAVATTKSTSPLSRPVTAGASPRYGTERNCTPVSRASSSVVMWEMEPFPAVPELTLPGAARALAMRSVKDLSRESRRTQIMKG